MSGCKRRIKMSVCLVLAWIVVMLAPKTSYASFQRGNPRLVFSVISDIHGNTQKLDAALRDISALNKKADALILNGDVVDQGLVSQYEKVNVSLEKNTKKLPSHVIWNIGNHEYYHYDQGPNTADDINGFINRYLDYSGECWVYHDRWIKGYHFISLGSEVSYTPALGANKAWLSPGQLQWLDEKIQDRYRSGKPVFLFLHQPLQGSVIGSRFRANAVAQDDELKKLLAAYPEVILFTSHTHFSADLPGAMYRQGYTIFDTASVTFPSAPVKDKIQRRKGESQGLVVEVYADRVTVRGRAFHNRRWLEGSNHTLML